MSDLNQKRKNASLIIIATVFGNAMVAATPKDNIDLAKQIFLTVSNVAMCMWIWDIYFEEHLYQKKIKSIFLELFFVIMVSAITAYIMSKAITVLSNELTKWLGTPGWAAIGAIAALAASLLGCTWVFYCDDLYQNTKQ